MTVLSCASFFCLRCIPLRGGFLFCVLCGGLAKVALSGKDFAVGSGQGLLSRASKPTANLQVLGEKVARVGYEKKRTRWGMIIKYRRYDSNAR